MAPGRIAGTGITRPKRATTLTQALNKQATAGTERRAAGAGAGARDGVKRSYSFHGAASIADPSGLGAVGAASAMHGVASPRGGGAAVGALRDGGGAGFAADTGSILASIDAVSRMSLGVNGMSKASTVQTQKKSVLRTSTVTTETRTRMSTVAFQVDGVEHVERVERVGGFVEDSQACAAQSVSAFGGMSACGRVGTTTSITTRAPAGAAKVASGAVTAPSTDSLGERPRTNISTRTSGPQSARAATRAVTAPPARSPRERLETRASATTRAPQSARAAMGATTQPPGDSPRFARPGAASGFADVGGVAAQTAARPVSPGDDKRGRTATTASTMAAKSMSSITAPQARGNLQVQRSETFEDNTIDVGGGMRAMKTVGASCAAPKPALGPKNSFFGTSERMEPTKWKRWANMVNKQTLGAHYDYIVGSLSAFEAEEDEERLAHDMRHADELHHRHPDDEPHPLVGQPRPPAAAAFTDRAARLREGRGAKAALMPPTESNVPPATAADCTCPVCRPHEQRPAGQPSHLVHYNMVNRCAKDHHPEPAFNPGHFSAGMTMSLPHLPGNPAVPEDEEKTFGRRMGRKIKHTVPTSPGAGRTLLHRSFSEDDLRAAGGYNQELMMEISEQRCKLRQAWQSRKGDSAPRTGVALALSVREDDPPPPTRIVSCTRAPGVFSDKASFTQQGLYSTDYFNQEVFRYADPDRIRGRSQPPTSMLDRSEFAGTPSGERGNHMWTSGNPVTMDGKDSSQRPLGSSAVFASSSFRSNAGNRSALVSCMLDHDLCNRSFAMEAHYRLQTEPHFAEMCSHTKGSRAFGKSVADMIKQRNGHAFSARVRDNLTWDAE
eukprot:CAMPEP_0170211178 /NCGR_PEP_ID=MMETSP0116_2-20130129/5204_1 /TAXON_ID=400756 /ORGANISM="Durinskia baltica, Strain CSIRO CS-38" /LENGTH=840 /DNA_ID=CAMNT_0010461711 /DNA_START=5 /DNA_END=2528 /DNA_ORIENTATION=-